MERKIDSVIVHCSDSPSTMDIGAKEIELWHAQRAKSEPWTWYMGPNGEKRYIGYHFVIRRSGLVESARPLDVVGNHCKGMNKHSIGVVWVGRDEMTAAQIKQAVEFVANMCVEHGLAAADVYGHCQFAQNKTCPNFNSLLTFESLDHYRAEVAEAIKLIK